MAYPAPPDSNREDDSDRSGILEGAGEHRAVRVEGRLELFRGARQGAPTVLEVPASRRCERAHVSFAQLAGAGRALGRSVEPNGEIASVEREGRRRRRAASQSCTLASHVTTVLRIEHCFVPIFTDAATYAR
jgi:hypothetical protein